MSRTVKTPGSCRADGRGATTERGRTHSKRLLVVHLTRGARLRSGVGRVGRECKASDRARSGHALFSYIKKVFRGSSKRAELPRIFLFVIVPLEHSARRDNAR